MNHRIAVALIIASAMQCVPAHAAPAKGVPFQQLQAQIDALQSEVDALRDAIDTQTPTDLSPIEEDVFCHDGDSINAVLATYRDAPNRLVLTVHGTCAESVLVDRSNVRLIGATPVDGISGVFSLFATNGAGGVEVDSMTLRGAFSALNCFSGSAVTATNVTIVDSARGVLAHAGACEVIDSTISRNTQGMTILEAGQVWLRGVDVTENTTGANVYNNGSLSLAESPNGDRSRVTGNTIGLNVFAGGALRPVNVDITDNSIFGIHVPFSGDVFFDTSSNAVISGSPIGIQIGELGSVHGRETLQILNNGIGVQCAGATGFFFNSTPVSFSGNGTDIAGACAR